MILKRNFWLRLTCISFLAAVLFIPACVSRYRHDLFQTIEQEKRKTKIEESLFVQQVVIGDPMAIAKLDRGDGNCIVLTTSYRGEQLKADPTESLFFGFFESVRCKLYVALPDPVAPGSISLIDNSLVQMMGRYEVPEEDKLFLPTEGSMVVDSVVEMKTLYGKINGRFANRLGDEISYDGELKVKIGN